MNKVGFVLDLNLQKNDSLEGMVRTWRAYVSSVSDSYDISARTELKDRFRVSR